jgi:hypothetical protein
VTFPTPAYPVIAAEHDTVNGILTFLAEKGKRTWCTVFRDHTSHQRGASYVHQDLTSSWMEMRGHHAARLEIVEIQG